MSRAKCHRNRVALCVRTVTIRSDGWTVSHLTAGWAVLRVWGAEWSDYDDRNVSFQGSIRLDLAEPHMEPPRAKQQSLGILASRSARARFAPDGPVTSGEPRGVAG